MKCKLGDIAEITMGQSPKSEYYNSIGNGIPFVQGNRTFGKRYITFDTYTTNPTKIARAGDIVMSVRAPVGDLNFTKKNMCLGRGVCSLRMKNGNQDYLYYLLKYNMGGLLKKESGTVFGSVNRSDIADLDLNIVDDCTQIAIGRFLSMLDDKIELNDNINQNLEQQVCCIFNSMFPSINIGSKTIGDYILPKRGKNLLTKNAMSGDIPVVAGGLEPATYHNVANTEPPVISISASGANAGYVRLWLDSIWSSDSSFIDNTITPNVYFWYILLKRRQKEIYDSQIGSAQPHIYPQQIGMLHVSEIDQTTASEFNDVATPFFLNIRKNQHENVLLSKLRDTLLPILMSGEIDILDFKF